MIFITFHTISFITETFPYIIPRNRSASYPGSVISNITFSSPSSGETTTQQILNYLATPSETYSPFTASPIHSVGHSNYSHDGSHVYLSPGRQQNWTISTNTFSFEAESIASVSVTTGRNVPVSSRTSLALRINSPKGEMIRTNTVLGTQEAVVRRCSCKYVLLKISPILQENTCVGVSFYSLPETRFIALLGFRQNRTEFHSVDIVIKIYNIFQNTIRNKDLHWNFWGSFLVQYLWQDRKVIVWLKGIMLFI